MKSEKKREEMKSELKKLDKDIEERKPLLKEKQKHDIFLQNFESGQRKFQNEKNKIEKKLNY